MSGLRAAIAGLLPAPPVPDLPFTLRVLPNRVTPTGLGGFIGVHHDPPGEVVGRRVDARVLVGVHVRGSAVLEDAIDAVTLAIAGRDASRARSEGLLRVGLAGIGDETTRGSGNNTIRTRAIEFSALFEYHHLPTEGEDQIERVPVLLEVGSTVDGGEVLLRTRFREGSLEAFQPIDDPAASIDGPSQWEIDAEDRALRQRSRIRGEAGDPGPALPGGQLLLRAERLAAPAADLILSTEFRSDSAEGLGLVFRWQDIDNFYFALLEARRGFRILGRKVNGAFEALEEGAFDGTRGFDIGVTHALRVSVQRDLIRMHVDGELALEGRDSFLGGPGRVGFLTHGNDGVRFYSLDVVAL